MLYIFINILINKIKSSSQNILSVLFALMIITLFSISIENDPDILPKVTPAILWLSVVLSSLLVSSDMYKELDGYGVDSYLRSPYPMPLLLFVHVTSHWIVACLPLILISPLLLLMIGFKTSYWVSILLPLIPGTLLFTLFASLINALGFQSRRSNLLSALILIPLFLPVLILGVSSGLLDIAGKSFSAPLIWLWAYVAFMLPLSPWLSAKIYEMSGKV